MNSVNFQDWEPVVFKKAKEQKQTSEISASTCDSRRMMDRWLKGLPLIDSSIWRRANGNGEA